MEDRTPSGMPPRFCEDEGLYVGRRPRLKWTNRIIVENRLLHRYDKVKDHLHSLMLSHLHVQFVSCASGQEGECNLYHLRGLAKLERDGGFTIAQDYR